MEAIKLLTFMKNFIFNDNTIQEVNTQKIINQSQKMY